MSLLGLFAALFGVFAAAAAGFFSGVESDTFFSRLEKALFFFSSTFGFLAGLGAVVMPAVSICRFGIGEVTADFCAHVI